jgi:hypothetical protein
MRDMSRDEMQDLLPELLHNRLSEADAAQLRDALHTDAALAAEYALLQSVSTAHRSAAPVNVSRIVAALPTQSQPTSARALQLHVAPELDELAARRAAKRPLVSTRFARAAALLLVVGGGTMVSVWSTRNNTPAPAIGAAPADSFADGTPAPQLGLGASTDDLSVEQLRALETDIKSLDGLPSADIDAGNEFMEGEGA